MRTAWRVLAVVAGGLAGGPAAAKDRLPEPASYAKAAGGGRFVFVMLGPAEADVRFAAGERAQIAALRARYPASGLYPADGTAPLWTADRYVPSENAFLAADGVHAVLVEGDWWRTKEYPAPKRLPPDAEAKQLSAPAVTFLANGKVLRTYAVRDLVPDPSKLKYHTPLHVLWYAGGVLNESAGRFVLHTQDAQRLAFDYRSGELESRSAAGLGNPHLGPILAASGAVSAAVAGLWAYLALGRRPSVSPPRPGPGG